MRRLLAVLVLGVLAPRPTAQSFDPGLAAGRSHCDRRLQPGHRHRCFVRSGVHRSPAARPDLEPAISALGRIVRSPRLRLCCPGFHRPDRSTRQLSVARSVRRVGSLPAGPPALGSGAGARRRVRRSPSTRMIPRQVSICVSARVGCCCPAGVWSHPLASRSVTAAAASDHRTGNSKQPDAAGQFSSHSQRQSSAQCSLHRQPRARSIIGAGIWAPPGSARCICRISPPLPERLTFGLPLRQVGAVFSWPGGVWAATNRTSPDRRLAHLRGSEISASSIRFPALPPLDLHSIRCESWRARDVRSGPRPIWAWRESQPADGRLELIATARGLPDSRVYSIVSRAGRITVGTAHGLARIE